MDHSCQNCSHNNGGECSKCEEALKLTDCDAIIEDQEKKVFHKSWDCPTCSKTVDGHHFEALGSKFHTECFVCVKCKEPIKSSLGDKNGMPICELCYEKEEGGIVLAKLSHKHSPDCSHDHNSHSPKGHDHSCRAQVVGICKKCSENITNNDHNIMQDNDGNLLHHDCFYDGYCYLCSERITGPSVEVSHLKFHVDCYQCDTCGNKISKFKGMKDGKIFCDRCY